MEAGVALRSLYCYFITSQASEGMMEEIKLWTKNIAYNYNHDLGWVYSQLIDCAKELGLDMQEIDKRWQDISFNGR